MKTHLPILVAASALLLAACAPKVGSERWCEDMQEKPKSEWSVSDAADYAAHCVLESTTIGSDAWCNKLEKKPKGDWTASEAADYAKHCVVK